MCALAHSSLCFADIVFGIAFLFLISSKHMCARHTVRRKQALENGTEAAIEICTFDRSEPNRRNKHASLITAYARGKRRKVHKYHGNRMGFYSVVIFGSLLLSVSLTLAFALSHCNDSEI